MTKKTTKTTKTTKQAPRDGVKTISKSRKLPKSPKLPSALKAKAATTVPAPVGQANTPSNVPVAKGASTQGQVVKRSVGRPRKVVPVAQMAPQMKVAVDTATRSVIVVDSTLASAVEASKAPVVQKRATASSDGQSVVMSFPEDKPEAAAVVVRAPIHFDGTSIVVGDEPKANPQQ